MINDINGKIEVKIIDFGLCDRIIKDGQHVPEKADQCAKGSYAYMSRASHEGMTLSRKDDWETLCYVIYALVNGELPWQRETNGKRMLKMKKDFVEKHKWIGLPKIFEQYADIIFNLGFTDVPSPLNLISILLQMNSTYYSF
jgi:serine/threonine protein kinase